jgi:hypothetical protein
MNNDPLKQAAGLLNENAPTGERLAFINPVEEAMLKKMGGSGEPSTGGVPSFKKGDVEAPPPRDYGKETADTLQAQVNLAPQLYANEAQFRPQYANLERKIMLEQLGLDPNMGLLDAYEKAIIPSQVRQKYASAQGEVDMIKELGPQLIEAQRSVDPLAEEIRKKVMTSTAGTLDDTNPFDRLVGRKEANLDSGNDYQEVVDQTREEFHAGQGLTETEQRDLEQRVLSGAADRGMEAQGSTLANAMEQRLSANRGLGRDRREDLLKALTARDQLERGRDMDYSRSLQNQQAYQQTQLQNAGAAYGMGNFDVLAALTGRSGMAPAQAQQQFGSAQFALESSPGIFNPESQYAGQLATQNSQAQMDARTATASNKSNMFSGFMQGLGSMGGGWMAGRNN